ncbi:MAG: 50S ribosomal protein L31e [Candidatus Woesearchaeota archaeon]
MAKEKETEAKIVLERTYNVPLRKYFIKAKNYKKTNRAVSGLREFLLKHMKGDSIKIGKYLNLKIWENGIRNPPHHVKVEAKKDDKGVITAEIVGAPKEKVKEAKKRKAEVNKDEKAKVDIKKPEEKAGAKESKEKEGEKKIEKDTVDTEKIPNVKGVERKELKKEKTKPKKSFKPAEKKPAPKPATTAPKKLDEKEVLKDLTGD